MLLKRILFALNGSLFLVFLLYFLVPFDKNNVSSIKQNGTSENLNSVETFQTRIESHITDQIENKCSPNFIAFIVPYRNRTEQLPQFLQAIHNHQNNNVNNVSSKTYI